MPDCFEILHKDLAGRIGRFITPHGSVETPLLMPVVNPHLLMIEIPELEKMGAKMLITNSYIISQDKNLREQALDKGLHGLLNFQGPIMTDSGAFQLSVYGDIQVEPLEILEFQQAIKSDVCVPLDIPSPPDAQKERALADLKETERRLEEAVAHREGSLLAGPIQGGTYPDLREASARHLRDLGFDLYPIGAVVPLMEAYRYRDLVEVIVASKRGLGSGAPVHLFGAGHPMVFALAAALGCDLFDSAAYALYARDGRYLTPWGTWKLEEMRYLPCSCPICQDYTASELQESPQRTKLLAMHNLYVSFEEMRLVKQHIWEGSLWDLLEARCRAHPRMLDALRSLFCHVSWMERLDKSSKSTFYYLGRASAARPEVLAYRRRLKRLELVSSVLLTDTPEEWEGFDQVLGWKPPFGAYPLELGETYPLNAEVPEIVDEEAILEGIRNTQIVMAANPQARFHLQFRDPKIKEALEATASFARDGND